MDARSSVLRASRGLCGSPFMDPVIHPDEIRVSRCMALTGMRNLFEIIKRSRAARNSIQGTRPMVKLALPRFTA